MGLKFHHHSRKEIFIQIIIVLVFMIPIIFVIQRVTQDKYTQKVIKLNPTSIVENSEKEESMNDLTCNGMIARKITGDELCILEHIGSSVKEESIDLEYSDGTIVNIYTKELIYPIEPENDSNFCSVDNYIEIASMQWTSNCELLTYSVSRWEENHNYFYNPITQSMVFDEYDFVKNKDIGYFSEPIISEYSNYYLLYEFPNTMFESGSLRLRLGNLNTYNDLKIIWEPDPEDDIWQEYGLINNLSFLNSNEVYFSLDYDYEKAQKNSGYMTADQTNYSYPYRGQEFIYYIDTGELVELD